jgi:hypothetical protein
MNEPRSREEVRDSVAISAVNRNPESEEIALSKPMNLLLLFFYGYFSFFGIISTGIIGTVTEHHIWCYNTAQFFLL